MKPTLEPLTLAELKAHLRVEVADDDATIVALLLAAREWVEGQTWRALMSQTIDFTYDWTWPVREDGRLCLSIPLAPVRSIDSIFYVDENGATQTLSASPINSLYTAVLDNEHPYVTTAYDAEWPTVRWQPAAITVRAVCGYGDAHGDVPAPLRLAIKLLVAHWYENREAVNVGNIVSPVPFAVEALVSPYRRGLG